MSDVNDIRTLQDATKKTCAGPQAFAPGTCERLEPYLESQVVGQSLALKQLCDAVCDHISNPNPIKPLVLSVHGPPGVGKSMVHQLAAKALYNGEPSAGTQCPGSDCLGYKVDYYPKHTLASSLLLASILPYYKVCVLGTPWRAAARQMSDFSNKVTSHLHHDNMLTSLCLIVPTHSVMVDGFGATRHMPYCILQAISLSVGAVWDGLYQE